MHTYVLHIFTGRSLVGFSRKSTQPFLVEINSQRIDAADQHINSEIELESVDKIWFVHISLNYAVRRGTDILKFSCQEYSFSLRHALRFDDEGSSFSLCFSIEVLFELVVLDGQHPSQREEIVLLWEFLSHAPEGPSQEIFPSKVIHSWKMVDFLM
jgi:hypothetical protein